MFTTNTIHANTPTNTEVLQLTAKVKYRHKKPRRFTQGLAYKNNCLYESSGLYGESSLGVYPYFYKVPPNKTNETQSIKISASYKLPSKYFGEGIALHNNKIIMLTWQEKTALFIDHLCPTNNIKMPNFTQVTPISYNEDGWGIAAIKAKFMPGSANSKEKNMPESNKTLLVTSNGSQYLVWRNANLTAIKNIAVTLRGAAVIKLNELEAAPFPALNPKTLTQQEIAKATTPLENANHIYANIWGSDFIAIINPHGSVVAEIDMRTISLQNKPATMVQKKQGVLHPLTSSMALNYSLNGIAYIGTSKTGANEFLVTGKNWNYIYRVIFVKK